MARTQSLFRRFAPAVLGASILFLGVSDAGGNCLAAWLCPPPMAEDSAHDGKAAWEGASDRCGFEVRVDNVSQKLEPARLQFVHAVSAALPSGFRQDWLSHLHAFTAHLPPPGPPLALYALQGALLL